ncbi:MAG: ABC-2 family transporter protein [Streptomycetaceae bacterium]|nr:ABC-2 family transporter protein [Streptomycetaceae bacterium]
MRVYGAVALRGFRRFATYRVATLAGVFTNTIFGFILAYTFIALWTVRPHLGGYDLPHAVTYVWLGQAMLATTAIMGGGVEADLIERIRTGDVAIDLYRPADLQLWWLAADLGRAGFQLLGRGVLPMVVGALVFPLAWPEQPLTWAYFFASIALGAVVSYAIRYLVALAAFWLLDGSGLTLLAALSAVFFSGMLLPLPVFPGWLGALARTLPWSSLLQVPADIFLGSRSGGAVMTGLAFQAGWALALLGAGQLLQAVATRKVVVQGG